MKKYALGTLCYCMIVIGATLPSHAEEVSGCFNDARTEQACLSHIPDFKIRCAKMGYIFDRAEWSPACGQGIYRSSGCGYFCKR